MTILTNQDIQDFFFEIKPDLVRDVAQFLAESRTKLPVPKDGDWYSPVDITVGKSPHEDKLQMKLWLPGTGNPRKEATPPGIFVIHKLTGQEDLPLLAKEILEELIDQLLFVSCWTQEWRISESLANVMDSIGKDFPLSAFYGYSHGGDDKVFLTGDLAAGKGRLGERMWQLATMDQVGEMWELDSSNSLHQYALQEGVHILCADGKFPVWELLEGEDE